MITITVIRYCAKINVFLADRSTFVKFLILVPKQTTTNVLYFEE